MSAQLTIQFRPITTRKGTSATTIIGMAVVFLMLLVFVDARVESIAPSSSTASQTVTGTFTGTYQDGLPVYRLPAMEITAQTPAGRQHP